MGSRLAGWGLLLAALLPVGWLALRPAAGPSSEGSEPPVAGQAEAPATAAEAESTARPPSHEASESQRGREQLSQLRSQLEAMMRPTYQPGEEGLLVIPEHLVDAPVAEQRAYQRALAEHARAMLDEAHEHLLSLEDAAERDPALRADVEATDQAIQQGERSLQKLQDELGHQSDAG